MSAATLTKQSSDTLRARDALILEHASMVQYMAQRMWSRCPSHVDLDDLINAATFGLIEAAQAFDPERGVTFSSFAQARIRGAMLDALRKMDWTPRSVLRKRRMLTEVLVKLESELGRAAEDTEVAGKLGVSLEEYYKLLDDVRGVRLEPLASLPEDEDGRTTVQLEDTEQRGPDELLQGLEALEALGEAITKLPDKERLVVTLYFYEELTLREIGAILKLTEGRISQLKTSALLRLRGHLAAHA